MKKECYNCKHYRYTRNTQRTIVIGLGDMTVGHPSKSECLLMPESVKVSPDHYCGQFKDKE